jgi:hypothetical protein
VTASVEPPELMPCIYNDIYKLCATGIKVYDLKSTNGMPYLSGHL